MIDTTTLTDAVNAYIEHGATPFPLPDGKKFPPPCGVTGHTKDLTAEEIRTLWEDISGSENVGIRVSDNVIVIDVDHYGEKTGADTLKALEDELGELPPTWSSTRRGGNSVSRKYFFSVPTGKRWKSPGTDIDVIQHTHRYAVVFPSVVDGLKEEWYGPDGQPCEIPSFAALPALPESWVDRLQTGHRTRTEKAPARGYKEALTWLKSRVFAGNSRNPHTFEWEEGSRYDSMNSDVLSLVNNAVHRGHSGLLDDLTALRDAYVAEVGEDRAGEFERSVVGAVSLVEGEISSGKEPNINWRERFGAEPLGEDYAVVWPVLEIEVEEPRGLGTESRYGGLLFSDLSQATIRSAEWVWGGENVGGIPVGGLTIVTGKPGDGKSTMCRWLASEITHGRLDGTWEGNPHSVLYLSAEESQDHMVTPSLIANGADMSRVHVIVNEFDPATDMEEVIAFCRDNDVRAVFVDPLSSYMGGTDSHRNTEVREALKPWSRLAEEIDGAVIAIVHQKKSGGSDFVSGINGSSAYGEVARAVFATAVDAESGKRVVSQGKNSLGPLMASHEYVLGVEHLETVDGKPKTSPRFILGKETDMSAGEIFNRNKKIDSGESQTAKSWLRDYLEANPGAFKNEVTTAAKGLYGVSSIEKAAKELRVRTETDNRKARWYLK